MEVINGFKFIYFTLFIYLTVLGFSWGIWNLSVVHELPSCDMHVLEFGIQ